MFYEKLKAQREQLGITLEQLASRTKISKDLLLNFEQGNFSNLPRTYARLFLKAYALEVGLNPQEILNAFEAYIGKNPDIPAIPPDHPNRSEPSSPNTTLKPATPQRRNFATIVIFFVIVIFLISILKQILTEDKAGLANYNPPILPPSSTPQPDSSAAGNPVANDSLSSEQQKQNLRLILLTKDSCWVKIITDNQDTFEANLPPHYRKESVAVTQFDLRVGRPASINLILNGKDLGKVGEPAIPTRVIITKDGIVRRQSFTTR